MITPEDVLDIQSFHRSTDPTMSETEKLCRTINYALDKFLSRLVEQLRLNGELE